MLSATCGLGRLDDVGRLRPFRASGDLKFYLLSRSERFKAIPHNSRKVDEHIVPTGLFDESISLLCVEPLHNALCCQDRCPPSSKRSLPSSAEIHACVPTRISEREVGTPRSSLGAS